MRKLVFIVFVFTAVFCVCTFAKGNTSPEKTETSYQVHYIRPGDTLWDIASLYGTENCDVPSYVNEIMEFNNMKGSKLISGQNIIVPIHKL